MKQVRKSQQHTVLLDKISIPAGSGQWINNQAKRTECYVHELQRQGALANTSRAHHDEVMGASLLAALCWLRHDGGSQQEKRSSQRALLRACPAFNSKLCA
jgi:hypothetical protein